MNVDSLHMYLGEEESLTAIVPEGCDEKTANWRSSPTNIVSISGSGAEVTLTGENAGTTEVSVIIGYLYKATCNVEVSKRPTVDRTYNFELRVEVDAGKVQDATYSEDDLKAGIHISAVAKNAADALVKACDAANIPIKISSKIDGNNNDLRGWIVYIFNLGTVDLGDNAWKYWVQFSDQNGSSGMSLNGYTLGYYENGGNFELIYRAAGLDGMPVDYDDGTEPENPDKPPVNPDVPPVNPDKDPDDKDDEDDSDDSEDDKPLIDEKTEVEKKENPDGSTTTTTTTTGKTEDGESVKIVDKVTEKDGVSTGTKTETVTDKDGNEIGNRVTESTKDKDGNTTSKTTATKTEGDGSKTSSTSESKLDKDGNGTSTSESVTTKTDGTLVSEKSTTEKTESKVTETKVTETKDADGKSTGKQTESKVQETLKDSEGNETGTLTAETKETVGKDGKSEKTEDVAVESKDGKVKTETTSKTDKDGKVKAETTTTVKSDTKDVGANMIDAALKQSEQALSNMSADKTKVTKTVEVEVSSGTSAALSPEAVKKVSDYGAGLKVSVKEGSIDTDSDVLKNLAKDGKTVELSMEANNRDVLKDKQKDIVGDNHFVDLNALVGGKNVHQLGGKAIITFGYQLKDGESAVDLKVYYVDDDGNKTLVDASFENGSFTMTVDHFSVYMVENTAAPAPVDPETPEDKDEGGISPVLIAGIVVVLIVAIAGVFLYSRKN